MRGDGLFVGVANDALTRCHCERPSDLAGITASSAYRADSVEKSGLSDGGGARQALPSENYSGHFITI